MKEARLVFEDGWVLHGESIGAEGRCAGRLVSHTDMTGYQELLSDPACRDQIVSMTYPLVGNVGVSEIFNSSNKIQPRGLVFREAQRSFSNRMGEKTFTGWIEDSGTIAISGVDTREIMRRVSATGAMRAVITTRVEDEVAVLSALARASSIGGEIGEVSAQVPYVVEPKGEKRYDVCVVDLGLRRSIADSLTGRGCRLTVLPYRSTAAEVLSRKPDGVLVTSGPAFTADDLAITLRTLRELDGRVPMLGVGTGFLAMAKAYGWMPAPMAHGHHGANIPVRDMVTGHIHITRQDHWIGLGNDAAAPGAAHTVTHRNVNDGSIEGIRFTSLAKGVQFVPDDHLECYGTGYMWEDFLHVMQRSE